MLAIDSRQFFSHVEQVVSACPRAELVRGIASMRIPAPRPQSENCQQGFDICVTFDDRKCRLRFDRWSLDFARNDHRAMELFEQAMHGDVRLRVDTIGGEPWHWTLERHTSDKGWVAEQSMGVLNLRFWGQRGVTYLCNDFGFQAWTPLANRANAA